MLRFVASFITSNTKSDINTSNIHEEEPVFNAKNDVFLLTREEYSKVTSDEEEQLEEEVDIQSLRQQKLRELAKKALLRKLTRQAVMNRYNRDHLPLSQIQEELKDDDVPLKVLQDKLKQKENLSIYTTIRENLNFLLYSKSSKPKKSRPTLSTHITDNTNDDISNNNNVPTPKDYRDYDVWDDAIIGRLMNLIDTIDEEVIQEEITEGPVKEITSKVNNELIDKVVKQVMKEVIEGPKSESLSVYEKRNSTFSADIIEKETIIAESSTAAAAIENNVVKYVENVMKDVENNAAKDIKNNATKDIENNAAKDIENNAVKDVGNNAMEDVENNAMEDVENNAMEDVGNNVAESVENETMEDLQENIQEEKSDSIKIAEEIINFGETVNVAESLLLSNNLKNDGESLTSTKSTKRESRYRRSIFSLGQLPSSSSNNKNTASTPKSLKRNVSDLNRRSSIHSKMSYENDISRRSSVSSKFSVNTTISAINEDDSDNIKSYKRASLTSNKLRFLKHIWKNNHNEEFTGKYYKQGVGFESENESRRNSRVEGPKTIGFAGANSNRSDPDYSNFYLSMPNGKWMVRTRTASRKITGTQYVDKEYI